MRHHAKASSVRQANGFGSIRHTLAFLGALILALTASLGAAAALADAPPTLVVNQPTEVGYTTAHVTGSINPNGGPSTNHWNFEYSSNPSDPGSWNYAFGGEISGTEAEGSNPVTVGGELQGLRAGTEYFVRLVDNSENYANRVESQPPYPSFTTEAVGLPSVSIDPVTTFTATTAHFTGTIDPEAPTGSLTPAEAAAYEVHWHFQCTPQCPGAEQVHTMAADSTAPAVSADAARPAANSAYQVRLIATNAGGPVTAGPENFTTATAKPTAQTIPAFVLGGGTKAQIGGRVNPQNSLSTYWFEYGTTTDYETIVPASEDADAGSGPEAHVFAREVGGLAPGTTYHFRVVAENSAGKSEGEDMTFTTPSSAPAESCSNAEFRTGPSASLSECRAYELVSTPDLGGPSARPVNDPASTQAWAPVAAGGDAAIWGTDAVLPGHDSEGKSNEFYVSRRGPTGWTQTFVSPPGSKVRAPSVLVFATLDLDRLIWLTFDATIDPADPDSVDGLSTTDQRFKDLYREEPDGSFVWLTRSSAELPAGGENIIFGAASADAQRVLFGFDRQLELGAPPYSVYERAGQTTTLVSRDENGAPLENARVAAVSDDGSMVAFGTSDGLYLRHSDIAHSIQLVPGQGGFESLSADGSRAVFNTGVSLTADDEDASVDLYEYNADTGALMRISAPSGSPAGSDPGNRDDCASPLSGSFSCGVAAVAVTRDGSKIYFVSPEQLDGTRGTEGAPNMYLREGDETRYIATLDSGDPDFGAGSGANASGPNSRHVRLTPDGSKLLLESRARLTAYDNAGHVEVYLYDPAADGLICASCRPSGDPPTGDASLREAATGSNNQGFAADPLYLANSDEHGRRLFFQSSDGILPRDRNGKTDVYEYDVASGTTSLISTGQGTAESGYYGNSLDGRDVFFFSTDKLAPQDQSLGSYKLYDARIGGGFAATTSPPPCRGDGCQGQMSAPPFFREPASSTVSGKGNAKARKGAAKAKKRKRALSTCRKKPPRARKRCESKVRKHFAKQPTNARRGK